MKKGLILIAAIVFMMVAGTSFADVRNSKHNLGSSGTTSFRSADTSEICAFCHTPHNATINVPLWSRSVQTSTYMLYTTSATLGSAQKGNDNGITEDNISFRCLGCHDGSLGPVTGVRIGVARDATQESTVADFGASFANLGTDLTNDHPIGFDYASAANEDADINAPGGGKVNGELPLFGPGQNMIECATCHDVHNGPGVNKFLRKSNGTSALCLTCHSK